MDPAALFQTFTVYPNLPPELQGRIIELSMQPRTIEVYIATQGICKKRKVRDFDTHAVKLRGGPVPAILHVNRAVRQEALRKYTAVVAFAGLSPLSSLSKQTYVNPEIDTFYIIKKQAVPSYNSSSVIPAFPPFHLMLPSSDDVVAFTKKIRHIAIRDPANSFLTTDGPVKNLLFQYQNLTHLEIIFDNRRKWTHPLMEPNKYKFTKAAGGRKCHDAGCNRFGKNCKLQKLVALLDSFEVKIKKENNEWKRPKLGAFAVTKKRG